VALALILSSCSSGKQAFIGSTTPNPIVESMPAPGAAHSMQASVPKMATGGIPNLTLQPSGNPGEFNTEEYDRIVDNPFLKALDNPVSTFSIDVDTASYANVRRYLMESGEIPPKDAVRIEEMVNYFTYGYPATTGLYPVASTFALSPAPWAPDHLLFRVALKAKDIETGSLPASNLVFLLDTSGSMADDNKLPLIQESLKILVSRLRPQDRVSIVAYAGSTGIILDATSGSKKERIITAFDELEASGSTAGGAGLQLAYEVAKRNFIAGGNNRVILCTDGDFNVGVSSTSELERMIEEKRKDNIFLTVIGVGMGNYKDSRMETLADKGNGNYAYIDNLLEGKKVLGKEIWGNLFAVAKDVKIQIEFNPAAVREYRLIGYENRLLSREDFNDDTKDAGEMGAGQTVTAFYELVPASAPPTGVPAPDPLAFQQSTLLPSDDLLVFKLRYKEPGHDGEESQLVSTRFAAASIFRELSDSDEDFRFASAVVEFGMLLRDSPYKAASSWKTVMDRARASKGADAEGYRAEFVKLVEMAELKSPGAN
jgi:Ca-activated chloride channel family protein